MRLRLSKLQKSDKEFRKIKAKSLDRYEEIDRVLYRQELSFVLKIIRIEFISQHHNNSLASHFSINKMEKLISQKYYWLSLRNDMKSYVKDCNVCLSFKAVRHKPYDNLQALPILTHYRKNFSIDFMIGLPISTK